MFFEIIKNMLPPYPVNLWFPLCDSFNLGETVISREPFDEGKENLDYLILALLNSILSKWDFPVVTLRTSIISIILWAALIIVSYLILIKKLQLLQKLTVSTKQNSAQISWKLLSQPSLTQDYQLIMTNHSAEISNSRTPFRFQWTA